jgi:hypothetical protein
MCKVGIIDYLVSGLCGGNGAVEWKVGGEENKEIDGKEERTKLSEQEESKTREG